jgi:hypothetical protein
MISCQIMPCTKLLKTFLPHPSVSDYVNSIGDVALLPAPKKIVGNLDRFETIDSFIE